MHAFGHSFKTHGTIAEITIYGERARGHTEIIDVIRRKLDEFENRFSRFRPESMLNELLRTGKIPLQGDFVELVRLCIAYERETDGYFNPTIDLTAMGYDRTFEAISEKEGQPITETVRTLRKSPAPFRESISFDTDWIHLAPWMALDFWAIAKGYAIDRTSEILDRAGFSDHIVNIGGDIRVRGNIPMNIGIQDPFVAGTLLGHVTVKNVSILTSGTYVRYWKTDRGLRHHIVNPLTNECDTDLASITLVSENATHGDALSTGMLAMGMERAKAFAKRLGLSCVLIGSDGRHEAIRMDEYWLDLKNLTSWV